jgi:hypothetical protein
MPVFESYTGMPGATAERIAKHRAITQDGWLDYLPGGVILDGTKTRDPDNPDYATLGADALRRLRAGLLVGKVTSSGKYANSVIGVTSGSLAGNGTSITLSVQEAVELNRRVGASGTLTLTGPPVASGTAKSLTATYSAVNTTTGVVTITALGVNQQEDVRLAPASTGGNLQLTVQKPDGTFVTTANIPWNATDATYLASIASALDTATGVVGGIVPTAISATDTDNGFTLTYAGTGYAGLPWTPAKVALLPTTSTDWYVVPRTTAVDGRFVAGSFVGDTDGSQTPMSFLPDGWETVVPSDSSDLPLPRGPVRGVIDGSQLLPWPADSGLKQWVRNALSPTPGLYVFTEKF